jgi:hypothetical protein
MKRIVLLLGLLLMISVVSAVSTEVVSYDAQGNIVMTAPPQEKVQIRLPSGLQNAIFQVKNNETAQHLEQVFAKIESKRELQFAKLQNMTAEKLSDNSTLIVGKGKGKFLGLFKMNKEFRYNVLVNGTVIDKPKPFDFIWSKQIVE